MANYKGIKGFKVQSHASDPTANEGQIWYNTTSYALKYDSIGAAAWSSGGNLNSGRRGNPGGCGTQTASLLAGGNIGPSGVQILVESYDGSAWTVKATLNAGKEYQPTVGTNTAAITFGGLTPPGATSAINEEWDGSAWTEVADLTTSRGWLGGSGTTTAAIAFTGGTIPGPTRVTLTETWNGTSWTETADLNTGRQQPAPSPSGSTTATLVVGGNLPPTTNKTETWNGTSWSEVANLNRNWTAGGGAGTSTSALIAAGYNPTSDVEQWDGTSWTEVANLSTGRGNGSAAGASGVVALCYSGAPDSNATEEWDASPAVVKTVTVS